MARRQKLTISIPEYMNYNLHEHVYSSHFASVSEYIRELIRRDLDSHANRQLAWAKIHADQTPTQQRADQARPMFRLTNWPGPAD